MSFTALAAPAKLPRGFLYIVATQHQFANLIHAKTEFLGDVADLVILVSRQLRSGSSILLLSSNMGGLLSPPFQQTTLDELLLFLLREAVLQTRRCEAN